MRLASLPTVLFVTLFTLVHLMALQSLEAATVAKVKGRKVLIKLEGDRASAGDLFYTISPEGKKKGILKVMKVKGDQAVAIMGKGQVKTGWALQFRSAGMTRKSPKAKSHAAAESDSSSSATSSSSPTSNAFWGGMFSFASQSMDVEIGDSPNTENVSLSGSGFGGKALLDYEVMDKVWFRGMGGLEMLSVSSGDKICGNGNQTCEVNITYLSLDFWGRYMFSMNTFRPWLGGGFELLFPMSKDATAVENSSITNTSIMAVGAGFDYFLSPTMYIPVQVEYGMFPSSDQVTSNYFGLRAGFAIPW